MSVIKLKMYIFGSPENYADIINDLKICLKERTESLTFSMSIVNVGDNPEVAILEGIVATPTLVMEEPKPSRRLIGDLSDSNRILNELGIFQ